MLKEEKGRGRGAGMRRRGKEEKEEDIYTPCHTWGTHTWHCGIPHVSLSAAIDSRRVEEI
jgi:hypothetical protein